MTQKMFFSIDDFLDVKPLHNFRLLFNHLNQFQITHYKPTGRKPILREAILKALVFKNLKSIPNITELYRNLSDNPSAALCCGFDIHDPIPSVERFSAFLNDTPNKQLVQIKNQLVRELIKFNAIAGKYLSIDSCPILANVKENNLKTNVKNRFDKAKFPKGDPESLRPSLELPLILEIQNMVILNRKSNTPKLAIAFVMPIWKWSPEAPSMIKNKTGGAASGSAHYITLTNIITNISSVRFITRNFSPKKVVTLISGWTMISENKLIMALSPLKKMPS